VPPKYTETQIKSKIWNKVLSMPGPLGGTAYWRVVGTRTNKTTVESDARFFTIGPPQSVGNPAISDTGKSLLPTLSWVNACNNKFAVWFGNDPDFSKPGIRKKVLTFNIKAPNVNGGAFSKMLTTGQWNAVRHIAENISGATIYWYVESRDALKRHTKAELKSFVLVD
jgi:hypothetical protein